jgi:hypothetical protein
MSDTSAKTETEQKRLKHGRSPAYPGLSISEAIAKAKALYDAEGKYAVPMESAFTAWGFGAKSSGGRETRAALKYYGLIAIEGDTKLGKIKLTDDALRVLLDEREDQTEKKAIIRRLALKPAIYKKLVEKFPDGIKSDATVEHHLIFEEGYNKGSASELLTKFKLTAAYADLFKPAIMPDIQGEGEAELPSEGTDETPPPAVKPLHQQVKIMAGERIVFTEEESPGQYLKLIASGDVSANLLEALSDYVARKKKQGGTQQTQDSGQKAN